MTDLHLIAAMLREAETTRTAVAKVTDSHADLTVEGAYAIQRYNTAARQRAGAKLVGRKIGITSKAVMEWLKVDEPDFGALLDDMAITDGGEVKRSELLQPRIEAEIAFVLGRDLAGEGLVSHDVVAATAFIAPALEIIDSRIADWKITYRDTVADNASSARFVLGSAKTSLAGLDLQTVGMVMRKNGRVVSTGAGAACLGNPVNAVLWLAKKLSSFGEGLKAGDVVLSGALGPVTPVEAGDFIETEIAHVGRATVRFT